MSEDLSHRIKKGIIVSLQQRGSLLETLCTVAFQVNLLSLLVSVCISVGFLTHFFSSQNARDEMIAGCSLAAFCVVVVFNLSRKYLPANVLFYVSLHVITSVSFRNLPGQTMDAVLMYIFLLSLIVFLFQETAIRVICMSIVLFRTIFLEINAKYVTDARGVHPLISDAMARMVFDGTMVGLIVLVFVLYGLKIYTVESIQKKSALFAQHMSHDLTVSYHSVASMISYLKYLSGDNKTVSRDMTLINELANASGFFSYILNNFLEFSRYERGRIETNHYEQIDLTSELEKIVDLYKYMADEKGIRIALVLDDELPGFILSDKVKVTRIVLNLLTNAINNTGSGKTITIAVHWKNGPWELSVANEGEGLPTEAIEQLFLPYGSKKTKDSNKRLGLGLPITKQLVEALGGNITAKRQKNRETLFTVAFPVE
ncbi:HAMP domain-containing sensor histidine kinase [Flavitalea sp. BT771]|uniref:sensor histidine kinase n=1 Tax=Flavitalea sp. BT771 TaxID=3063329 RepID=UPI0026E21302|nr:HAMP domain-containing sensor histidine kinase [Flavitalea sp. BT771]MDO6433308.1 HAMP domain-containing sensor histidine kinase [Flavitalea sp. BT771]MDV6222787.1 HAMP domain-containing sensor histidine kinase [Flavitalea sp. BT771]